MSARRIEGMSTVKLGELQKGATGRILSICPSHSEGVDSSRQLLAMGLLEGARVEIVHEAPFGGDPIAIRVRGSLIALRRSEANQITIEPGNN